MYQTIVVAGPPYSGVELVARQVSEETFLPIVNGDEIADVSEFNQLLEGSVVLTTTNLAHLVHEFTGNHVVYVMRDVEAIERELELAEYDSERHMGNVIKDLRNRESAVREALDQIDQTLSLPRFLYAWWEWQKGEIEFWFGTWEERHWEDER